MVTGYKVNQIVNYDLLSFLKNIDCSELQFKLLCFWARHSKAKLSLYTMAGALETSRINLRDAITGLVEKGILITQYNSNGLTTYALSDQQVHEHIGELAELDWNETGNLRKQLKEGAISPTNNK